MMTFLDQDILHIARVMPTSLSGVRGGAVLPAEYWRRRLHRLLDSAHLTKIQLGLIDDLLLLLDQSTPNNLHTRAADSVNEQKTVVRFA